MPPRRSATKLETRYNENTDDSTGESKAAIAPKKTTKTTKVTKTKVAVKPEFSAKVEALQDETESRDVDEDEGIAEVPTKSPSASKTKRKTKPKKADEEKEEEEALSESKTAAKRKRKAKAEPEEGDEDVKEKSTVKKRKTKQEKENEAVPLAMRTEVSTLKRALYIGAHVSASGGNLARTPGIWTIAKMSIPRCS